MEKLLRATNQPNVQDQAQHVSQGQEFDSRHLSTTHDAPRALPTPSPTDKPVPETDTAAKINALNQDSEGSSNIVAGYRNYAVANVASNQPETLDMPSLVPPAPAQADGCPVDSAGNAGLTAGEKEDISISLQKSNWEHLGKFPGVYDLGRSLTPVGPTSWITISSQPGIRWVTERTGSQDFAQCAQRLTLSWSERLKFQWDRNRPRAPDLDADTAWCYTRAYFDDSLEAVCGVVFRPEFEHRLAEHLKGGGSSTDDAAWYALRNSVYASGCRAFFAKQSSVTWAEAQRRSWPYLENALSVQLELMYTPTDLMAVRALAAMNLHIEGAGNPALESMMFAVTVRVAQSKGLHRQPASTWNLSDDEILHRNWLFWAIFTGEKQVTHRSGRPSAIDDDNISCQVPEKVVTGGCLDIQFMTVLVKHAQISGQICRRLLSVSSFQQTPAALMDTMHDLTHQLKCWHDSLPASWRPDRPMKLSEVTSTRALNCALYIRFNYYGSLTAINTIFFFPWISAICGISPQSPELRDQIVLSTKIVADAARNIIRATKFIQVDAASHQWLVFYYPMVGLVNLFLYILKYPSLPSAAADVALLDMVVGHFGHLEDVTNSDLAYPFAREVSAIAHKVVSNSQPHSGSLGSGPFSPVGRNMSAETALHDIDFSQELAMFGDMELDMDSWNMFFDTENISGEGDMIYLGS